jgi:hypothetical protein
MFFAQITETLFEVTIPDSSIAKPAAMNMTRKPQIKNNRVLKINPTSADTVVSAIPALLMFSKNTKLSNGAVILFINLVIRPPVKEKTYNFNKFKN